MYRRTVVVQVFNSPIDLLNRIYVRSNLSKRQHVFLTLGKKYRGFLSSTKIGTSSPYLLGLDLPQSKIRLEPRRRWGTSGNLVRSWNGVEIAPREGLHSEEDKPRRGSSSRRIEQVVRAAVGRLGACCERTAPAPSLPRGQNDSRNRPRDWVE